MTAPYESKPVGFVAQPIGGNDDASLAREQAAERAGHTTERNERGEMEEAMTIDEPCRLRPRVRDITQEDNRRALATPAAEGDAPNLQDEIRACGKEPAEVRPAWLIRDMRKQRDLLRDDVTRLRRVHRDLGELIEAMTAKLGGGNE